jgi:hypothetical protein
MKKATIKEGPSALSLKELPEIDFSFYRIQRNPYAARIQREGVQLSHCGPSTTSLKEMPEADFNRVRIRPNRYAASAVEKASRIQYGRGRPRKGDENGPTPARTLRLPEPIWKALEQEARERSTTVHALLRELVATYVTDLNRRRPV